jgi:hypothetical protein
MWEGVLTVTQYVAMMPLVVSGVLAMWRAISDFLGEEREARLADHEMGRHERA